MIYTPKITHVSIASPTFFETEFYTKLPNGNWRSHNGAVRNPIQFQAFIKHAIKSGYTVTDTSPDTPVKPELDVYAVYVAWEMGKWIKVYAESEEDAYNEAHSWNEKITDAEAGGTYLENTFQVRKTIKGEDINAR